MEGCIIIDGQQAKGASSSAQGVSPSAEGLTVRGTAIVGVGLVSGQVATWALMLVATRALGPVEYGLFGSLTALLVVGTTVPNAVQVVVARHVASGGSEAHVGGRSILFVGVVGSMLLFAAILAMAPWLRLDPIAQGLPLSLMLIPLTVSGWQLGMLQGREQHVRLGALYFVAGATRSGAGAVAALVSGTTSAVIVAMTVGATLAMILGHLMVPEAVEDDGSGTGPDETGTHVLREVFHALHALLALFAVTNLDILIARAVLPEFDAGLYAAGALVARAVFFAPYAILIAAFPRMVSGSTATARRQSILAVGGLGLGAAAVTYLLPNLALTFVAGVKYQAVAQSLWIFALAGAGFGLLQVVLYTRLADSDRRAAMGLWVLGAALLALGTTLGSGGVAPLALCAAGVAWVGAIVGAALAWSDRKPL